MNFFADSIEDDDAAAATLWMISLVPRVVGSTRRSLVNVRAMPPVASAGDQHKEGGYNCTIGD